MAVLGEVGKTFEGLGLAQVETVYTIGGTVTRDAAPAFARVYVFATGPQILVGATISDPTTGAFALSLSDNAETTVVITDDAEEYNAQVFDRVVPL